MSKRLTLFAAALVLLSGTAILPAAAEMNHKEKTVTVGGAPMYPSKNIIQNAVNSKDHTTLVAAVKAAGLVDTLQGAGPFTVFAPTNAAFGKLPAGTVDNLVKPENKGTLTSILTYHVVPGRMTAAGLMKAVKEGDGCGQAEDRPRRRADGQAGRPRQAHRHRRQGRRRDRHHRRRAAVERRHPCDRHRPHADVTDYAGRGPTHGLRPVTAAWRRSPSALTDL